MFNHGARRASIWSNEFHLISIMYSNWWEELYRFTEMNIAAYAKHYFKTVGLWDLCIDVTAQMKHLHNCTLINSIKAICKYLCKLDNDY